MDDRVTLELTVDEASLLGAALRSAAWQVGKRDFHTRSSGIVGMQLRLEEAARHSETYMRYACKLLTFCRNNGVEVHTYPNGKRTAE